MRHCRLTLLLIVVGLGVVVPDAITHARPQTADQPIDRRACHGRHDRRCGGEQRAGRLHLRPGWCGQLIAAVPEAQKLAKLRGEQISNIGSQDMNDEVWLKLASRVNALVTMSDVNGVVITHGTDTIEETAYFLNLVVKSKKPVVLTAAMRPATALSADGPLNFFNAVAVAANKDAAGRGVLVVVNDWIHGAASLTKTSTTAVQTFLSPQSGSDRHGGLRPDRVLSRADRPSHRRFGVFTDGRHRAAACRHHHGAREHGRRAHRRGGRRRRQGHRDRRRRQRQSDGRRPSNRWPLRRSKGHRLRAGIARRHRPGRPQRRARRRQARLRGVAGQEPPEGARAAAAGAAPETHR